MSLSQTVSTEQLSHGWSYLHFMWIMANALLLCCPSRCQSLNIQVVWGKQVLQCFIYFDQIDGEMVYKP